MELLGDVVVVFVVLVGVVDQQCDWGIGGMFFVDVGQDFYGVFFVMCGGMLVFVGGMVLQIVDEFCSVDFQVWWVVVDYVVDCWIV